MPNKSPGMIIDGILASECIDKSAEILSVAGADISDWETGSILLNYEHFGDQSTNPTGLDIVGKVVYAKKIYKESDCENDRQRMYWKTIKTPMIYGICRLFDGAGHKNAEALAAIIRDNVIHNEKINIGYSVEGSTLDRKENQLKKVVIRKVALTTKPCNASCIAGLLYDPNAPSSYEKDHGKELKSILKDLAIDVTKSHSLIFDNFDDIQPFSKRERDSAKNVLKTMVINRAMAVKEPLALLNKLMPIYLANAAAISLTPAFKSDYDMINRARNAPITVNFSPSKLPQLVRDGRYKNLFESTNAYNRADRDERKVFEHKIFGIPMGTPYKNRPVYGALHLLHGDEENSADGGAPMFGSAWLALKSEVSQRSTFTHNDSFVVNSNQVYPYSSLDKVVLAYLQDPDQPDFIECQIHGGVDFYKDVAYLVVPKDTPFTGDAITFGKKYGVAVFAYDDAGVKAPIYIPGVQKTLTAGSYNAAPGSLTGGAALQVEDLSRRKKIRKMIDAAFAKNGIEKTKENVRAFIKANLPEIDEDYLENCDDSGDDLKIQGALVRKTEFLTIELCKSEDFAVNPIDFRGINIDPGLAVANGKLYYLLDETPDSFIGMPSDGTSLEDKDLIIFPKSDIGSKFSVNKYPSPIPEHTSCIDGSCFPYNIDIAQHDLVNSTVMSDSNQGWSAHPDGQVFLEPDNAAGRNDIVYSNILKNVFGLNCLPNKALMDVNGRMLLAQQNQNDAINPSLSPNLFESFVQNSISNGLLDKMLFADYVLGIKRNIQDLLLNKDGIPIVLHGSDFGDPKNELISKIHAVNPMYFSTPISPESKQWILGLSSKDLYKNLVYHRVPVSVIQKIMERFDSAKNHAMTNSIGRVY